MLINDVLMPFLQKQTNKNDCAVSTYQRAGMFLHLLFGH